MESINKATYCKVLSACCSVVLFACTTSEQQVDVAAQEPIVVVNALSKQSDVGQVSSNVIASENLASQQLATEQQTLLTEGEAAIESGTLVDDQVESIAQDTISSQVEQSIVAQTEEEASAQFFAQIEDEAGYDTTLLQQDLITADAIVAEKIIATKQSEQAVDELPPSSDYTGPYLLGFDDIFQLALGSSDEYLALTQEVDSKIILKDKEEKYYYPTATLNSESTKYYGSPTVDEPETHEFVLTLESKLYGTAVSDKIAASEQNLQAGTIALEAQELTIYYTVLNYLTKIELTREYQKAAEELREEIETYYLKQINSTNEGVSTQSDAMQAKLSVAEFDESVYSVVSNIEQYFKKLSEETGIDLSLSIDNSEDKIGIDYQLLEPLLAVEVSEVTPKELLATNAELQKLQKSLKSTLLMAGTGRERFTIELTSENHLLTYGDSGEYEYGDTDDSYIELNFELDLFNYGLQADQNSSYKMYEAEKLRFDKQFKQYIDQYRTNLTNYNQQLTKRKKTAEQIEILASLIENQKEEVYIDTVTYKDVVESIDKLNKAKQTLLNIDIELFDILYQLETLKSHKVL